MNHATIRPRGRNLARFIHELLEAGWIALQAIEEQMPIRRRHALVRVETRHRAPARRGGPARRPW
jgi:hypothetical protein